MSIDPSVCGNRSSQQRKRTYSDSSSYSGSELEELEANLYGQLHHEPILENSGQCTKVVHFATTDSVATQAHDDVLIENQVDCDKSLQQDDVPIFKSGPRPTSSTLPSSLNVVPQQCVEKPVAIDASGVDKQDNNINKSHFEGISDVLQVNEKTNCESEEETKYSYVIRSTDVNQIEISEDECSSDDNKSIVVLPRKKSPTPPLITVSTSDEEGVKADQLKSKSKREKKEKLSLNTKNSRPKENRLVSVPVSSKQAIVVVQHPIQPNKERTCKKRSLDVPTEAGSDDSCVGNIDALNTNLVVNLTGTQQTRHVDKLGETRLIQSTQENVQKDAVQAMEVESIGGLPNTSTRHEESRPPTELQCAPYPASWTPAMVEYYNAESGQHLFNMESLFRTMRGSRWPVDYADMLGRYGMLEDNRYFRGRRIRCSNCHQWGHIARFCPDPRKELRCYMCGQAGHLEPRCPHKICLQCGSPNGLYSNVCVNCAGYWKLTCKVCSMYGHNDSNCPDMWRREYYKTSENSEVPASVVHKDRKDLFCCNCTRKGHLFHECVGLRYSTFLPNLPYVVCPDAPMPDRSDVLSTSKQMKSGKQRERNKKSDKKMFFSKETHEIFLNFGSSFVDYVEQEYQVRLFPPPFFASNSPSCDRVLVVKGLKKNKKAAFNFILAEIERAQNQARKRSDRCKRQLSDLTGNCPNANLKNPELDNGLHSNRIITGNGSKNLKVTINNTAASADLAAGGSEVIENSQTIPGKSEMHENNISPSNTSQIIANEHVSLEKSKSNEKGSSLGLPRDRVKLLKVVHGLIRKIETSKSNVEHIYRDFCRHREQLSEIGVLPSDSHSRLLGFHKTLHTLLVGREQLGQGAYHMRLLRKIIGDLEVSGDVTVNKEVREQIGRHHDYIFRNYDHDNIDHLMSLYWKKNGARNSNGYSPSSRSRNKTRKERRPDNYGSFEANYSGDFIRNEGASHTIHSDKDYEYFCSLSRRQLVKRVYKMLNAYKFDNSKRKHKSRFKNLYSELQNLKDADDNDGHAIQKVAILMASLK